LRRTFIFYQKGQIFGFWTVEQDCEGSTKDPAFLIKCKCVCGTVQYKKPLILKYRSRSCGCQAQALKQRTFMERYGTSHPMQNADIQAKVNQTLATKYGAASLGELAHTSDIEAKIARANVEKYGCSNPQQNVAIRAKTAKTNLRKYGFEIASKNPEIRSKIKNAKIACASDFAQNDASNAKRRKTNLEKYGVEYISQVSAIQKTKKASLIQSGAIHQLSSGSTVREYCLLEGVCYTNALRIYREQGELAFFEYCAHYKSKVSSNESLLISIMKDVIPGISLYNKQPKEFILNRRPDFRLEVSNFLLYVNVDGLFSHSKLGRLKLDNNYHLNLQQNFHNNNCVIFQFRQDELVEKASIVRSIICNYLGLNVNKIGARKCVIREVSCRIAKEFYRYNHLMGFTGASKHYGLYNEEKLVSCLSVKLGNDKLEIARFCSLLHTTILGGFSKLLKYIEEIHKPSKIISYCDMRYSTGISYKKLGFTLESTTLGWKWTDFNKTYNRLKCRANMDSRGLSQAQYAEELGWYKIYDAGQAKYVKVLNK